MKVEEVTTSKMSYKGYKVIKTLAVHATRDEIKKMNDLTAEVLKFVADDQHINFDKQAYSFGRTNRSCFSYTFHLHLLEKTN